MYSEDGARRNGSPRRSKGFHGLTQRGTVNVDTEDQQRDKENNDAKVCIFLVTDSNIKQY